ncbi:MAG: hypothetical protein GX664_04230 [Bacteroidales bacterium]|nr:hypothetical protein [Bacteroidales bacterium]
MEAMHADVRETRARVVMHFPGLDPLELTDDDIVSIDILEETQTDSKAPIGRVTSNECTLVLRNDNNKFTPTNDQSPLYGKILPNVIFEVFLGVVTSDGVEYVPMGTFRTGDWVAPYGSIEATVIGNDKILQLSSKPIPSIPTMYDVTIAEIFKRLFEAVGLTESQYIVDESLDGLVRVGWIPKGDFIDVVSELATAGNCSVYVNRLDQIVVKSNNVTSEPVDTFGDYDLINDLANPQRIKDLYTGVSVAYYKPQWVNNVVLATISDVVIDAHDTITLSNIEFNKEPVDNIHMINGEGMSGVDVRIENITARSCDVILKNTTDSERRITFDIVGSGYQLNKLSETVYNEQARDSWGNKLFEVDNKFIQSAEDAIKHANSILELVSDPYADFNIVGRGNLAIEVMDAIYINAASQGIVNKRVVVLRNKISYDGALSIDMDCRTQTGG